MDDAVDSRQPARATDVTPPRRRKRRRIAEEDRKRAVVACANCRRLKEKCDGNVPCERCSRQNRHCQLAPPERQTQSNASPNLGSDEERIQHLESIARHFLGNILLDVDQLRLIVSHLPTQNNDQALSPPVHAVGDESSTIKLRPLNTTNVSDRPSYQAFSQESRNHIDTQIRTSSDGRDFVSMTSLARILHSKDSALPFTIGSLPPWEVATFLHYVYFEHAETNHFFAENGQILGKLEIMYDGSRNFKRKDAPWICTVLMILAVGSQFAHMENNAHTAGTDSSRRDELDATEDAVGARLYEMASKLLPDIVAIASLESVQALLLLAHFTLPLDTHGLACMYLGMALTKCVQLGMHRNYEGNDLAAEIMEMRTRLWWTAYGLNRRLSILHRKPVAIASTEIDVPHPIRMAPGEDSDSNWIRMKERTMVRLTEWLRDFDSLTQALRRCPKHFRSTCLERLVQTRDQFKTWWASQTPSDQITMMLSRDTKQLHLSYHLNLVFAGRPFMLDPPQGIQAAKLSENVLRARTELIDDAVYSAYEIIKLCGLLDRGPGLAKASYVEFTACRAAVLVVLAQVHREPSQRVRETLLVGIRLIRKMTVSVTCGTLEASILPAMDAEILQLGKDLESQNLDSDIASSAESQYNYTSFVKWAASWKNGDDAASQAARTVPSIMEEHKTGVKELLGGFDWNPLPVSLFDADDGSDSNTLLIHDDSPSTFSSSEMAFERIRTQRTS